MGSYNLLDASSFTTFLEKSDTSTTPSSVSSIVSFGDDRYGAIYRQNGAKSQSISGFIVEKGAYKSIGSTWANSLSQIAMDEGTILSNTASAQQIVIFDNGTSKFQTIDLFEQEEKERIKEENKFTIDDDET